MTKKQRALEIIERLKKEYPEADCTLDYDQAWKLLVSVRLAAQCTDARVNVVVEKLYEKFPDVNALAEAPVEEITELVREYHIPAIFTEVSGSDATAKAISRETGCGVYQLDMVMSGEGTGVEDYERAIVQNLRTVTEVLK